MITYNGKEYKLYEKYGFVIRELSIQLSNCKEKDLGVCLLCEDTKEVIDCLIEKQIKAIWLTFYISYEVFVSIYNPCEF